ncbi:unnamed protein product [Mycena citricolor]|uniref:SAP domain-containing protein n=1 Tax=Mycena citricolor TaxID=2018698 RepID=A0AAD2Q6I1_9AGAR|nr:unnamed protein product [Mycena citricolor]
MHLTATDLANYNHLNCDLFLHNAYHRRLSLKINNASSGSELSKAQFARGLEWEQSCLFPYLDRSNQLLTIPGPIDGSSLSANIEADDRDHFYIAGVSFWPPSQLEERFREGGFDPVKFGLAKPDLLEITRTPTGVTWKVIDAKAAKTVKTSHHVQIYFYSLCLSYILPEPFFKRDGSAAVWLPPADGFTPSTIPSLEDIRSIQIDLLAPSLDELLFRRLPKILGLPKASVRWHLNPLCRDCAFESECAGKATEGQEIGCVPNISLAEAEVIRSLLGISRAARASGPRVSDIEDLHDLFQDEGKLRDLVRGFPSTIKRAKRILSVTNGQSPLVEAARKKAVQIIPRRNFTCPRREDIAIIVSLIQDPSMSNSDIAVFGISVFSVIPTFQPQPIFGDGSQLVPQLASLITRIDALATSVPFPPLSQFYVFSAVEHKALQTHLIQRALSMPRDVLLDDLRMCIGALAEGASLLQTTFQPLILSGALLSFMHKGQFKVAGLRMLLQRMGLSTAGSAEELRQRIQAEIHARSGEGEDDKRTELGQLPRVVVLKREIESLLALPIPGSWDLPQCASALLPPHAPDRQCPDEEEVYQTYRRDGRSEALDEKLEQRNSTIYAVLQTMRSRVTSSKLLVNDARVLTHDFLDICEDDTLRKLFFMQQFEVLAKLLELWRSRIDGCPDAPLLEYKETVRGSQGAEHEFILVSGAVEMSSGDKAFYDHLLTADESSPDEVPVAAFFDDLGVCGLVFPLTRYTRAKWDSQNSIVRRNLLVADIRDISVDARRTRVTLKTWGEPAALKLVPGCHYRLSQRLVDFNTHKILTTLLDLDLRVASRPDKVPFLQIITDTKEMGSIIPGEQYRKVENNIQSMFRQLKDLGGTEAAALVLKSSQHRAVQRILCNRLSVIWGPPGTGKTYTIALALLRLLQVQYECGEREGQVIFVTAMTHAAINAVLAKLYHLKTCYKSIDALDIKWLGLIQIEHVLNGHDHSFSKKTGMRIFAGTVWQVCRPCETEKQATDATAQLYNLSKRHSFEVDVCVIDEAGQLALSAAALVLKNLSAEGRVILAGDSEQLAPILAAEYSQLSTRPLFGSILDCLMHLSKRVPVQDTEVMSSQGTIVQLTENFRSVQCRSSPLTLTSAVDSILILGSSYPPSTHERSRPRRYKQSNWGLSCSPSSAHIRMIRSPQTSVNFCSGCRQ